MTSPRRIAVIAGSIATLVCGGLAVAQLEGGERGVPPIDSSANYEVGGVQVDVSAKTADQARSFGWRLAQRRAWAQLWAKVNGAAPSAAPNIGDAALDQITSGIEVENEEIGAHRYIASLAVLFDRGRSGRLLGVHGADARSVPMLVIPVMWSGGAPQSFERRTEWQKAWARFRSGGSPIDYVRPVGTGIEPLVLNAAQAERPGRGAWRRILDGYGAADVLVPTVRLARQYPGGPVSARFTAIHGPDGAVVAAFDLTAPNGDALPRMLDEGVRRIDAAYAAALRGGALRSDPSLVIVPPAAPDLPEEAPVEGATSAAALPGAASTFLVQVDTADDPALVQAQSRLRAIAGVQAVNVDSVALGGVSVMRIAFGGDPEAFRTALAAAGYSVEDTGGGIRLRARQ
ncbi:heavy-metal-associated domain-containing protein [uncultured Sphingomonas sp.]|uniref:heavy-metal-associated domain-containing protein n=1 Tax=uncultured Sphingomonas sp. TaxID=158754 RepID=UPI0025E67315|nr:heavy-metal-associated domain-containing protein [uncultured Sphingomonas sp.]